MARENRDPSYGLAVHIATGRPASEAAGGDPAIQAIDQELDRNNPMDPAFQHSGDNFIFPQSAEAVHAANLAQAAGLSPQGWGYGTNAGDAGSVQQLDIAAVGKNNPNPQVAQGGPSYGDHSERGRTFDIEGK